MQKVHTFLGKGKFNKRDLVDIGLADSEPQIPRLIKDGILPPPFKNGEAIQARVWWTAEDVETAFIKLRERAHRTAAE